MIARWRRWVRGRRIGFLLRVDPSRAYSSLARRVVEATPPFLMFNISTRTAQEQISRLNDAMLRTTIALRPGPQAEPKGASLEPIGHTEEGTE